MEKSHGGFVYFFTFLYISNNFLLKNHKKKHYSNSWGVYKERAKKKTITNLKNK